jgi:SAM-dependent methyltransferase
VVKTTAQKELTIACTSVDHEGVQGMIKLKGIAKLKLESGSLTASDTSLVVKNANAVTICISAATNFVNYHDISGDEDEKAALLTGFSVWKEYYSEKLYDKLRCTLRNSSDEISKSELTTLRHHHKSRYIKLIIQYPLMTFKSSVKKMIPDFLLRTFYKAGLYKNFIPAPGKINMGDFNRTTPYSNQFGYDRGGPVDRYYIENFLQKQAHHIKGRVLEIGDNEYTLKYGGSKVGKSDVLHIEEGNKKATFVGDLSNAPQLPDNAFDCIVLTQTLHLIYEYKEALRTCYRVLKPGGVLLMTVPGISHIDQGEWKKIWLWSFTESSIIKLLEETFPGAESSIEVFGNVLVATAFLYGIGLPELKKEQMDQVDEHYQVIITVAATKPVHS